MAPFSLPTRLVALLGLSLLLAAPIASAERDRYRDHHHYERHDGKHWRHYRHNRHDRHDRHYWRDRNWDQYWGHRHRHEGHRWRGHDRHWRERHYSDWRWRYHDRKRDWRHYGNRHYGYHGHDYRYRGYQRPPRIIYRHGRRTSHYVIGGFYRPHRGTVIIHDYRRYGLYPPPHGHHWVHDHGSGDAILRSAATGAIIGLVIGALSH